MQPACSRGSGAAGQYCSVSEKMDVTSSASNSAPWPYFCDRKSPNLALVWSKQDRFFRHGNRRWVWRPVGATRKRRTYDCAISDSTETIKSAYRTS